MRNWLIRGIRILTCAPEFNVLVFAVLLNWPWEFLQVPFFSGMSQVDHWQGIKACTRATFGDAVLVLCAYWLVAVMSGGRYWAVAPTLRRLGLFVAAGLVISVVLEKLALSGLWAEGWSYSERMPTLWGIGVAAVLQWTVLPPLVIWFSRRQLGPCPQRHPRASDRSDL